MKRRYVICYLFFLFSICLDAQTVSERELSWTEFTDLMTSDQDFLRLEETKIHIDIIKDSTFRRTDTIWENSIIGAKNIVFIHEENNILFEFLSVYNVITGQHFKKFISLEGCNLVDGLRFHNCNFDDGVAFYGGQGNEYITFHQCHFKSNIYIHDFNGPGIILVDCTFERDSEVELINNRMDKTILQNACPDNFILTNTSLKLLKIKDSNCLKEPVNLHITDNNIHRASIINTHITRLDLQKTSIERHFFFENCQIDSNIIFDGTELPEADKINLLWKDIAGFKIAIVAREPLDTDLYEVPSVVRNTQLYKGRLPEELDDTHFFNQLIGVYKFLQNLFKSRGDRLSFNGCFMEMKDLETGRAHHLWLQEGSLRHWFDWRLNQFLKYFCDYGTSPVKALIRSMWTILLFALLYFFFYSDWDRINRSFLIRQHRRLLRYFRSEIRLEELYHEDYQEEYQGYDEYRRELEESRVEVPYYIHLLGRPLYHLSQLRHRAMGSVYRRLEVLGGVWKDLPPRRQWVTGALGGVAVGGYLLHLALVRTLNSVMLSINTFSTLGFGDIPVRGWIRYAAILEGFLGWFLLSIFSVSLISQILQV